MDVEHEIILLQERNKRVETDKRWERSFVRKITIIILTYLVAVIWLMIIHEPHFWWKAVVPAAGYLLSTLSLTTIKKLWAGNN